MVDSSNEFVFATSELEFKENPNNELLSLKIVDKEHISKLKSYTHLLCKKIKQKTVSWEDFTRSSDNYCTLSKERDKHYLDKIHVEGRIEYTKRSIDSKKEEIVDIEPILQEAIFKLTELEHEKNKVHEHLKAKHNAYKRVIKYYKVGLDLYVRVEKEDNICYATVCFFTQVFDDTYSFLISQRNNESLWLLEKTTPKLGESQFSMLQKRFHKTNNMSALLDTMYNIFKLYKNCK